MKRFLDDLKGARKIEWILLAAAVAMIFLFMCDGSTSSSAPRTAEETRIISVLSRIEGVGKNDVLISEGGILVVAEGIEDVAVNLRVQYAIQTILGIEASKIEIVPYGN